MSAVRRKLLEVLDGPGGLVGVELKGHGALGGGDGRGLVRHRWGRRG